MPATLLSKLDATGFSAGQPKKTPSNVLMAPIMLHGERNPEIQPDDEVTCLFDPSSFDGTGKMNVTFGISEATAAALEAAEKAIGAAANAELHSSVKRKDGYPPSFRTKYTADRIQFQDEGGQPTQAPETLRDLRLKIIVSPRSVYFQTKMAGVIWDLAGVQVLGKAAAKRVTFE
jgi:hypothetical protein